MRAQGIPGGVVQTQNDLLMEALQRGEILTPYSALQIAGTLRLSERIRELVRDGVPIDKAPLKVGRATVMSYKLGGFAHG